MKTAHKTTPQERTGLKMTKWIKASPARVFEAWTRPEQVNKWFAPDLTTMAPKSEIDLRVGGSWRIIMQRQEGESPTVGGKYLEIIPNRKITFSWVWEGTRACGEPMKEPVKVDSVVTVEFREKDGGTEITLTHERLPNEDQVNRHAEGWTGCIENLARFAQAK